MFDLVFALFANKIPVSLANTTSLQVINLRANAFSGIIPSFGTLPNLIELDRLKPEIGLSYPL